MLSDVFLGKTMFRLPHNLLTGEAAPNTYNGHPVSERYIKAARAGISDVAQDDLGLPADFYATRYLTLNPDVAAAQVDAKKHYLAHGWQEGRHYK